MAWFALFLYLSGLLGLWSYLVYDGIEISGWRVIPLLGWPLLIWFCLGQAVWQRIWGPRP
jgi:hypothetical protein